MKLLIICLVFILVSCGMNVQQVKKESIGSDLTKMSGEIIDLTYAFSDKTVYWVTSKEFELEEVAKGQTDKGYFYAANNFETSEHGGTHIDAPVHFAENGVSVDKIPLEQLIGSAVKIDVSEKGLANPDYQIKVEDIQEWEKTNGEIPEGSIVLLYSGHSQYYPDKGKYLGTTERGAEAVKDLHFPGLSPEAANWLMENRKIKSVGIDTPSIDHGQSEYFKTHVALMTHDIPAFENVANMDKLPAKGFKVIALPIKIEGGSGGPLRIVAILE
ncbi:cyclase family protein [Echinicola sp. CAU 1574]|uniref:Cyclase family protein n=1 Tax=Echinicola arenosa TaxID=2774144 RepID=A0ABR9APG6_9BACT|nr:cyclase family protein [Echinicola arenosa]MBD8490600.1 cyclase family protein [Echinicola arenosa]